MQILQFQPRPLSGRGGRRRRPLMGAAATAAGASVHAIGAQAKVHALVAAANAAGYAPSIHDSQPWRWRVDGDALELYLDGGDVDEDSDTDGRLAMLSCGAALHHARVSLAADGWGTAVSRPAERAGTDLLARLRVGERSTADRPDSAHLAMIPLRYTDRDPAAGAPVGPEQIRAITAAARAEDTWLHVLHPDEILDLADAAAGAETTFGDASGWSAELAYWSSRSRALGIRPARAARRARTGPILPTELPTDAAHDTGATFVLLHGPADEPDDWLRAGEALSAAWLTATGCAVSVLPLSAPIEVAATRATIQVMIGAAGYPYLLLRLGTADPATAGLHRVARLPADQLIERL